MGKAICSECSATLCGKAKPGSSTKSVHVLNTGTATALTGSGSDIVKRTGDIVNVSVGKGERIDAHFHGIDKCGQGGQREHLGHSGGVSHGKYGASGALHLEKLIRLQRLPVLLDACCTRNNPVTCLLHNPVTVSCYSVLLHNPVAQSCCILLLHKPVAHVTSIHQQTLAQKTAWPVFWVHDSMRSIERHSCCNLPLMDAREISGIRCAFVLAQRLWCGVLAITASKV